MPRPALNRPKTSSHSIRIPDEEWAAAKAAAHGNDVYVTAVVDSVLRSYVAASAKAGTAAAPAKRAVLTADPGRRVPNRVIQVKDDLWAEAMAAADKRGQHLAEVIRRGLRRYVSRARRGAA